MTIDGRPALDVYDEWLGGGLKEAMKRGENMLVWCALHPLTRNVTGMKDGAPVTGTQFLHPHPNPDQKNEPGSILVGANVTVGETTSPASATSTATRWRARCCLQRASERMQRA